jgi:acyl carrier protein
MSIESIIAKNLKIDESEVTDDKKIVEDLGGDSLNTVEIVMELETEFGIEIPDEDTDSLITVGDIREYIEDYA